MRGYLKAYIDAQDGCDDGWRGGSGNLTLVDGHETRGQIAGRRLVDSACLLDHEFKHQTIKRFSHTINGSQYQQYIQKVAISHLIVRELVDVFCRRESHMSTPRRFPHALLLKST